MITLYNMCTYKLYLVVYVIMDVYHVGYTNKKADL